jgi:hypothetical protein
LKQACASGKSILYGCEIGATAGAADETAGDRNTKENVNSLGRFFLGLKVECIYQIFPKDAEFTLKSPEFTITHVAGRPGCTFRNITFVIHPLTDLVHLYPQNLGSSGRRLTRSN